MKDYIRPTIYSIRVYPIGKKPFNLELSGWGENYRLKSGDTIGLPKNFYLGINADDKQNDSQNSNGVFEVNLFVDYLKVYGNRQEKLDFSTGRYINTFIDFAYYSQHNKRFQRSYIGKQNQLKIYTEGRNSGMIHLADKGIQQIRYQVKDANGNISQLKFYAFAAVSDTFDNIPKDTLKKAVFYADKQNEFESDKLKLSLPANSLYDSLDFHFDVLPANKNSYSSIYRIHQKEVPVHKFIYVSIKVDSIPKTLKSKMLIAGLEDQKYSAYRIKWDGSWATASIRSFGKYTVVADTVKPQIKWINSSKEIGLKPGSKISFKIKDELSGIESYNGYFNGEWVLFEYDAKNDVIFHIVEPARLLKENKLRIEVVDQVGNSSVLERTFNKL